MYVHKYIAICDRMSGRTKRTKRF